METAGPDALVRPSRGTSTVCGGMRGALLCSAAVWTTIGAVVGAVAALLLTSKETSFCSAQDSAKAAKSLASLVFATACVAGVWVLLYVLYVSAAVCGFQGLTISKRAIVIQEPYYTVHVVVSRLLTIAGALVGVPWAVFVVSSMIGAGVLAKHCSGTAIAVVMVETAAMLVVGAFSLAGLLCGPAAPSSGEGPGSDEAGSGRRGALGASGTDDDVGDPSTTRAHGYRSDTSQATNGSRRGGRGAAYRSSDDEERRSRRHQDPGSVITGRSGGTRNPTGLE